MPQWRAYTYIIPYIRPLIESISVDLLLPSLSYIRPKKWFGEGQGYVRVFCNVHVFVCTKQCPEQLAF